MQWGKFSTSLSTQNYSVGPAIYNQIVLSRQGGSFPHVKLALDPFDLNIKKVKTGKWEVNLLAGMLSESDYFDTNSQNNSRYINGLFLAYQPSFLPELTLGFNKVLYKDTQFFNFEDIVSTFYILDDGVRGDSIDTNDTFDQLASATMDWHFPEFGFRVYGEFSRNDFSGKILRFFREPEHSRAYTIGLERRIVTAKKATVIITAEHTNLSRNHTFLYQAEPSYYMHHVNRQGYTHNGQLLGAGIGPGGNSDQLRVRLEKGGKISEILVQRVESNKDYFVVNIQDRAKHDIEYSVGYNIQKELPSMLIGLESTFSYNFNKYYLADKFNMYLAVSSRIKLN